MTRAGWATNLAQSVLHLANVGFGSLLQSLEES